VLVTGANGFIGHWLVQALADRGDLVHALVRARNGPIKKPFPEGTKVVTGEVTDLDAVSRLLSDSNIDTVFHLAAINTNIGSSVSPYDVLEANTRGAYTILEACRRMSHPVGAVISSSKEAEDCFRPANGRKHHPYMASKAANELFARAYFETAGVAVAVVRLANIYGGGDLNWNRLVPGAIRAVLQGKNPVIRSDGLLQRDYVYVSDAVDAFIAVSERLHHSDVQGQLLRVTTGIGTSVLEMVKEIAKIAGRPDLKPQIINEKTEERVDTFYMPEYERKVLGWSSQTSLAEGLTHTYQWYHEYFQNKQV
jgi:CDP-glucose 4,6-dehydratase